jgi:hypothetical protein
METVMELGPFLGAKPTTNFSRHFTTRIYEIPVQKTLTLPAGDGCSAGDIGFWFKDSTIHPKPSTEPAEPRKGPTLAQLPPACRGVVTAP